MLTILKHPVFLVSLGGALGANARYWLGVWIKSREWSEHFPLGTFLANVSGCLVLAFLAMTFLDRMTPTNRLWFLFLGTGFCGAYTTFSTFEVETWNLIQDGRWPLALFYVVSSVLAGFVAVVVGASIAKSVT